MTASKGIPELLAEVEKATDDLRSAETRESHARRDTTEARNRLNEAQKAFDAAVQHLHSAAPGDTVWKRQAQQWRDRP